MTNQDGPLPSSATAGFFQSLPIVPPQYSSISTQKPGIDGTSISSQSDDVAIARILGLYLPQPLPERVDRHLHEVAKTCVDPSTLRLCVDAEMNTPTLHPLNTFGQANEVNALRVGEGWRRLKDIGIQIGSVASGYDFPPDAHDDKAEPSDSMIWNRRIHQFATVHLWSASAALVTCPAAMTDGAAILLGRHLESSVSDGDQPGKREVIAEARRRLISFDPSLAWTSGQWMTERTGGSDVSETETVATRLSNDELDCEKHAYGCSEDQIGMPLGPWRVEGFKWFSSATDADVVVLLARTARGISVFYAPMRRLRYGQIIMNGIRITRLKQKLGTKALPTSELEIKGMRAWLIGEEGKGTKEISAILNTTRLWTAGGAVGGWARGLAISRAYSLVRKVKGQTLAQNLQHVRWMADETVKYRAALHFAFLGAALNGVAEQGVEAIQGTKAATFLPASKTEAEILLRVLTPVMKAQCSLASVEGLREQMESLGGVGYCENMEDGGILNIARLYRDTNVNPIWEGTVSVMVEDFVRAVKGKQQTRMLRSLAGLIQRLLRHSSSDLQEIATHIQSCWTATLDTIERSTSQQLLYQGRTILHQLESIVCAGLLISDAGVDADVVALGVASRWFELRLQATSPSVMTDLEALHDMDRRIFLGARGRHASTRPHL